MDTKILVCCHKEDIMVNFPPYAPIQVGKSIAQMDLGITGDDTGENISEKNAHYCELTGLYWAWKNLSDSNILGLVHYRRYFDFHHQIKLNTDIQVMKTGILEKLDLSVPEYVKKKVQQGSVVLAKPHVYGCSLYDSWCQQHNQFDLKLAQSIIRNTQPEAYYEAFMHVMYLNNKLSPYNMFIMNRNDLDKYCQWLFPILEEVEKGVDLNSYGSYYGRLLGFLAERLLNVWCYAEKKYVLYFPVIKLSDTEPSKLEMSFGRMAAESILKWSITRLTNIKYRHMYGIK